LAGQVCQGGVEKSADFKRVVDSPKIFIDDVNTCSDELVYRGHELIQLESSKPIPTEEGFVFLRYEKTLPKFDRFLEETINHLCIS
jgi:hypothetical protein